MSDFDDCDMAMAEMDMDELDNGQMVVPEEVQSVPPTTSATDPSKPWPADAQPTKSSAFQHFVATVGTVKKADNKPITHVMMDEGRLLKNYKGNWTFGGSLSLQEQDSLFTALVKDHDDNILHPLVEAFPSRVASPSTLSVCFIGKIAYLITTNLPLACKDVQ
jgi:hypothetical protein